MTFSHTTEVNGSRYRVTSQFGCFIAVDLMNADGTDAAIFSCQGDDAVPLIDRWDEYGTWSLVTWLNDMGYLELIEN